MEQKIHVNYKKAANFIYLSAGIGLLSSFFQSEVVSNTFAIIINGITLAIMVLTGYIVSLGKSWIKYILLVFFVLGLLMMPFVIKGIIEKPLLGIVSIVQTVIQLYTLVLLFKVPKEE